jgi:hypothetical protein
MMTDNEIEAIRFIQSLSAIGKAALAFAGSGAVQL